MGWEVRRRGMMEERGMMEGVIRGSEGAEWNTRGKDKGQVGHEAKDEGE